MLMSHKNSSNNVKKKLKKRRKWLCFMGKCYQWCFWRARQTSSHHKGLSISLMISFNFLFRLFSHFSMFSVGLKTVLYIWESVLYYGLCLFVMLYSVVMHTYDETNTFDIVMCLGAEWVLINSIGVKFSLKCIFSIWCSIIQSLKSLWALNSFCLSTCHSLETL